MKSMTASSAPWRALALALSLGAGLATSTTAFGQATANPPERMTYQGFLVDGNGTALGNSAPKNYDVIFRIWSSETGTSNPERLWSEQQTVTVDKGYFSVLLGEGTAVGAEPRPVLSTLFKGATASDRYVGITVKGIGPGGADSDIQPRLRLLSSPYAYLATQATKLVRADNSNDLLSGVGNVLSLNGELDIALNNTIEFGVGVPNKEASAGKIGYATFTAGALDIVGAGTANANNRAVKIWAEAGTTFSGPIFTTSGISGGTITGTHVGDGSALTGVAKLGANTFTGYQEIQNHLRIGELATTLGAAGWGEALIFSGAPPIQANYNSDNSDPLWMARYNAAANASELRMVIGDDPETAADRFVVGTLQGNGNFSQTGVTWSPQVTIDARGFLGVDGRTPDYPLHFPNTLGDKITLWGDANAGHYGFGIDNSTLLVHGDGSSSAISFGYGRYGAYTETARIHPSGVMTLRGENPYLTLSRNDGRVAYFWRDSSAVYVELNLSHHNAGTRYALYNGDSNWDFGSDRKLKKDIVDAQPVLERVEKVQVRNFRWKESPDNAAPMIGVVAQELLPLFPDMVTSMEDPKTGESTLMVGYGDFGVISIKAIQELKARHDAELKHLKDEVAELKAQMRGVLQAAAELREQADQARTTAAVTK